MKNNPLLTEVVNAFHAIIDGALIYPSGHYKRIAALCVKLAEKIGLPGNEVAAVHQAALLHDIGLVYFPADIIRKEGEWTPDEKGLLAPHPAMAVKILSHLSPLQPVLPLVRHHHEEYNGKGYPDGIAGEQIPRGARLIHIVESYIAITSSRSYRTMKTPPMALEELAQQKGSRYDGGLVDEFIRLMTPTGDAQAPAPFPKGNPQTVEKFKPEDVAKEIFERVRNGKIELPVLPGIVQELQNAVEDPDTTVDDLVKIVEKDAAISIRLVSSANSPMYMGPMKARSTREAVSRLGFKEIRNIVSVIFSKRLFQTKSREYMKLMEDVWLHSLASAHGARFIADFLRFSDPEKYFLMGLVHDIGKVLIVKTLSENKDWENHLSPGQVEKILAIGHNSLGGVILRHWKFPKEFFEVATSHEGPKFFETTSRGILVVNLAGRIASSMGYNYRKEESDPADLDAAKRLKMDSAGIAAIGEKIKAVMLDSAEA